MTTAIIRLHKKTLQLIDEINIIINETPIKQTLRQILCYFKKKKEGILLVYLVLFSCFNCVLASLRSMARFACVFRGSLIYTNPPSTARVARVIIWS